MKALSDRRITWSLVVNLYMFYNSEEAVTVAAMFAPFTPVKPIDTESTLPVVWSIVAVMFDEDVLFLTFPLVPVFAYGVVSA